MVQMGLEDQLVLQEQLVRRVRPVQLDREELRVRRDYTVKKVG
jgi:hypothetical protein